MAPNKIKYMEKWFVYIVECSDGSYYCGITNDVQKRIKKHDSGKGAKYTRGRGPVRLLCSEAFCSRSEALKVESMVKKQKKENKITYLQNIRKESEKTVI